MLFPELHKAFDDLLQSLGFVKTFDADASKFDRSLTEKCVVKDSVLDTNTGQYVCSASVSGEITVWESTIPLLAPTVVYLEYACGGGDSEDEWAPVDLDVEVYGENPGTGAKKTLSRLYMTIYRALTTSECVYDGSCLQDLCNEGLNAIDSVPTCLWTDNEKVGTQIIRSVDGRYVMVGFVYDPSFSMTRLKVRYSVATSTSLSTQHRCGVGFAILRVTVWTRDMLSELAKATNLMVQSLGIVSVFSFLREFLELE